MSNWNKFISLHGLKHNNDYILTNHSFAQSPTPLVNFFCDHYHYGTIQISGMNASKFINDLTTIDVNNNDPQCMFGSFCSSKGNVITNFIIIKKDNNYLLRLPKNIFISFLKHINKYKPLYKITIEDVSDNWLSLGIYNPKSEIISKLEINQYSSRKTIKNSDIIFIKKYKTFNVYEILTTSNDQFKTLWNKLNSYGLTPTSNIAARAYNIREKIVDINPEIINLYTPNHLEYEKFNGINFNKGCYLGQEIIARIKHRTKLQTTLQSLTIMSQPKLKLQNSSKIFNHDNKVVGTLLDNISIMPEQTLILIISKHKLNPGNISFHSTQ
jgi:folate-binding protein YgfZ